MTTSSFSWYFEDESDVCSKQGCNAASPLDARSHVRFILDVLWHTACCTGKAALDAYVKLLSSRPDILLQKFGANASAAYPCL